MEIGFGILGCGHIAQRHAEQIKKHPKGRLIAAFDIIPEKTTSFCKEFNIKNVKKSKIYLPILLLISLMCVHLTAFIVTVLLLH